MEVSTSSFPRGTSTQHFKAVGGFSLLQCWNPNTVKPLLWIVYVWDGVKKKKEKKADKIAPIFMVGCVNIPQFIFDHSGWIVCICWGFWSYFIDKIAASPVYLSTWEQMCVWGVTQNTPCMTLGRSMLYLPNVKLRQNFIDLQTSPNMHILGLKFITGSKAKSWQTWDTDCPKGISQAFFFHNKVLKEVRNKYLI